MVYFQPVALEHLDLFQNHNLIWIYIFHLLFQTLIWKQSIEQENGWESDLV